MKKIIAAITFILLVSLLVTSCIGDTGTSKNESQNSSLVFESSENSVETSDYTLSETSSETSETSDNTISGYLKKYNFITEAESKIDPKDNVSRSTSLKIVMRLCNDENYALKTNWGEADNPKHTFTDINSEEIGKYASCALHIGIIDDSGDHLFRSDDNIKASEFVTWLLRALKYDDKFGHFDANEPWELSDLIGLTDGQYDSSQALLFEDLLECSITALKTKMKNSSMGLYYYSFVYKRFDVEYPEVFQADEKIYIVIDEFDSFETINVGDKAVGRVMYSGDPKELLISVLDPSVATFTFLDGGNYNIAGLKEGQTSIKITSPGDSGERKEIGFINVVVNPDLNTVINRNLDIILANVGKNTFGVNKKEEDLAKEFPKEFGELVALGENSIYYFNQIYINKDNSPTRRAMAWYVIQNIKKLDPYNRFRSTSPDYNYWIECFPNSVIDSLNNFTGITYKISLLDRKTESVILKLDNNDSNKNVEWSREDKYAALSHGYYSEIAGIIDVKNAKFITLPDKSKLESSLGVKLSYTDAKGNIYSDVLYRFMEWTNDNNLKVNINLYNEKYGGYNAGYFIFDISKNKIVDSSFKVVLEQVLYPKDIVSKIRWYLDTMTQNNTDYLNEMELAEKYPEEFEALIALGEKAFPIYDEMISKFENFEQRGLAMYVKYTLKPELYKDYSFDSPYGNYSLKSSIISFTGGYNFGILYGNFNLVDKKTGEVLIASNISLPDGQTEVNWSKDGKYVSISSGWIRYATDVYIFDIEDKKLIEMPSLDEIDDTLKHGISYSYYGVHFRFKEWLPDNKVRIEIFTVISATQGGIGEGWYIYDLKANKIVDGHYEITEEPMFNN
ncbi:MAG: hypothetical protein PHV95_01435 [Eubacteriales bacterium]|nr:hypothetical protein [Eubacteriales bacterium]